MLLLVNCFHMLLRSIKWMFKFQMPFYWDNPNLPVYRQLQLIANPWLRIQSRIGSAEYWPADIRRIIWCSYLGYRHRIDIVTFAIVNGIRVGELVELVQFCNPRGATATHTRKIRDLFPYLTTGDRPSRYFAFDLISRRVVNLDGSDHIAPEYFRPLNNPPLRERRVGDRVLYRGKSPVGYHC